MKKKTLSLILALVMCLGLTVPAMAANPVTLTDGGLSVTLSDVLFEEDVTIHFNDYGEEHDETVHIYRTPEVDKYAVAATNSGKAVQSYSYGYNAWQLSLKDGVWTAVDSTGIGDGTDGSDGEVWASGASWDILEALGMSMSYDSDALFYTSVQVKDGDREEYVGFFCVGGDQPMAADKPADPDAPAYQVSNWAKDRVAVAVEKGLAPEGLGKDYRVNITRAQFAAVAVKLYEAMAPNGEKIAPAAENPFTDTDDPDVLRAAAMGFVGGVGGGRFDPNALVTREQAAVMLSSVYTKLGGEIPVVEATSFADDGDVASWARNAVAFMNSKEIITGVGDNRFSPKGDASIEQALLIALKMCETLK
ncbi:MAG: S-layer homology domain-containing protein [Lawsonibacter sp.]|nr:S-layer homology domain-containing protein [Lawsonibacter sp.]